MVCYRENLGEMRLVVKAWRDWANGAGVCGRRGKKERREKKR